MLNEPLSLELDDDGPTADTLLADMAAGWDLYKVPMDSTVLPDLSDLSMADDLNGNPSRAANAPGAGPSLLGSRVSAPSPRPGSPLADYYDTINAAAFRLRCAARLAPVIARLGDIHTILADHPSESRTIGERLALKILADSIGRAAGDLAGLGQSIRAIAGGNKINK